MKNIEFKAELRDPEIARRQCELLGADPLGTHRQVDTYYRMPDGRLKRRETEGGSIEWVFYHRADELTPKVSNYTILSDQDARRRWGIINLRSWVVVRKVREAWLIDNVRIHLDDVERVGRFIEFEAMVNEKYNQRECRLIIAHLREQFSVAMGEPISVSYADLMKTAEAG